MRAAVLRSGQMVVDEVAAPVPGPGQLLGRVMACGICGSDLHAVEHGDLMVAQQKKGGVGGLSFDLDRDVVMGHEFCVEVLELGPGATGRLSEGDLVTSIPMAIHSGRPVAVGFANDLPGGYGELLILSEMLALPVPNGLAPELAAMTEPMAVGRHAVEKANATKDDVVLVVGCGPVGLAVIAALKQKGLGPIIAADFSPRRRALAEALGADEIIDPSDQSPYDRWQDVAWPDDADRDDPMIRITGPHPRPGLIFECVGVPGVLDAVMEGAMRDTRVVVVGVCMQQDLIRPLTGIGKELNLQFVLGYSAPEFADTLRGIAEGELAVEQMITGRVGVDGVPQAFRDLADPEAHAKIIVEPWR
jgi:threonine dehydrogenase-like Zn-dependent dehydrogenase